MLLSLFSHSQDTLVIKGSISNVDVASLTLIAYNTGNSTEYKSWKVFHQKVINIAEDPTFSFHIEHDEDYMYVILIEDFEQPISMAANRILYKMKQCLEVEVNIKYERVVDHTIDYVVIEGYEPGTYSISKKETYN
jgi:hypothetical protein